MSVCDRSQNLAVHQYSISSLLARGAAAGMGLAEKIGSIEEGKLADLIVLDRDLFEIDPHDIYKAKVEFTMMGGVVRHRDGI